MFGLGSNTQLGIGISISLHNRFSGQAAKVNQQLMQMRRNAKDALYGAALEYRNRAAGVAATAGALTYGMFNMYRDAAKWDNEIQKTFIIGGKGLGKSRDELRKMSLEMSKVFTATPYENALVLVENARAGIRDNLGGITKYQLAAAAASGEQVETVGKSLLSAQHAYQIANKDFGFVANSMVGAANASMSSLQSLGKSIEYAGFSAKRAGVPFQDLLVMVGMLSQKGIEGSSAGVGLNNVFTRIAKSVDVFATPKQRKAWATMGVNPNMVKDLLNQGKMLEVMMMIGKATSGMEYTKKMSVLDQLFQMRGNRGLAGVIEGLFGNRQNSTAIDMFKRIREEVYQANPNDIAMKQAKEMTNTPYGQLKLFKNATERFKISFYTSVLPMFTRMVKFGTKVIDFFAAVSQNPLGKIFTRIAAIGIMVVGAMAAYRVALLSATFLLRGQAMATGVGGFRGLMGGMLGNIGAMGIAGNYGGLYSMNKAGRAYVAAGQTMTVNGKLYKAGQLLPANFAANAAKGTGFLGRIAGTGGRVLGVVGRAAGILGTIMLVTEGIHSLLQKDSDKKISNGPLDEAFYKHMAAMGRVGAVNEYYGDGFATNLPKPYKQKAPVLNQTINLNVDGRQTMAVQIPQVMDDNMSNEFNFEIPE